MQDGLCWTQTFDWWDVTHSRESQNHKPALCTGKHQVSSTVNSWRPRTPVNWITIRGFTALYYWSRERSEIVQLKGHVVNWKCESESHSVLLILFNPMDYIVHGILQARILEWVAFPFFRGSSQLRDQTQVSHIAGGFFTSWATGKLKGSWIMGKAFSIFSSRWMKAISWLFLVMINCLELCSIQAFPGGTVGKGPACQWRKMQEMGVQSRGQEDPLE